MPLPAAIAATVEVLWAVASLTASLRLGSTGPLWLCWPARTWDAHRQLRAAMQPRCPNYTVIRNLERELGISD
ncbi:MULTISPECIES: hypothetical protein [Streptomyces]|uniref:hypothetical protein n=1 Tax=Streptomyces TaxID=1883 RepID=UPI0004CD4DBF|nr:MULTISPECIES: hypothetical protein [Streptomyces]